jgi:hypothetical protein
VFPVLHELNLYKMYVFLMQLDNHLATLLKKILPPFSEFNSKENK